MLLSRLRDSVYSTPEARSVNLEQRIVSVDRRSDMETTETSSTTTTCTNYDHQVKIVCTSAEIRGQVVSFFIVVLCLIDVYCVWVTIDCHIL